MQVAIHAGAAFTDEGRLLTSLQTNNTTLSQTGTRFFGPRRFRQVFNPVFQALHSGSLTPKGEDRLRNVLPSDENAQRAIFLSNEFAGDRGATLLDGQLYPRAGERMALLEHAFHGHQVEIFLALKNLGSFIPKLLMSLPEAERAAVIDNTDLSCLSWIGMIDDIRDLAPNVKITLWCNEDTPFIWGDIIRAIADLPDDTPINKEFDLLLSLLTDEGKQKAADLTQPDSNLTRGEITDALALILTENAEPDKIEEELDLSGWNSDIVDAFSELYEQDIDRLETTTGVRFLRP